MGSSASAEKQMNPRPYSVVSDVLRFTLTQIEKNLVSRPDDTQLLELRASVRRRLALLDGWTSTDGVASQPDQSEKGIR